MSLAITILVYFIGIPLGMIAWKIAWRGINIHYKDSQNLEKEKIE